MDHITLHLTNIVEIDNSKIEFTEACEQIYNEIRKFGFSIALSTLENSTPEISVDIKQYRDDLLNNLRGATFSEPVLKSIPVCEVFLYRQQSNNFQKILLQIEYIELSHGSIISHINATLTIPLTILGIFFGALSTPQGQAYYNRQQRQNYINEINQKGSCVKLSEWRVDETEINNLELDFLNYDHPGIDLYEKSKRVCYVQLSLNLAQGTPYSLSGVLDNDTKDALKFYAAQKAVPNKISNQQLRAFLLEELKRKRRF